MTLPAEHPGIAPAGRERLNRNVELAPLLERLAEHRKRWGAVRAWALAEMAAGRRPSWRPADVPVGAPNARVVEAYLDHIEGSGV